MRIEHHINLNSISTDAIQKGVLFRLWLIDGLLKSHKMLDYKIKSNGKKKKHLLPEERYNFRLLKGRKKVWLPKGGE